MVKLVNAADYSYEHKTKNSLTLILVLSALWQKAILSAPSTNFLPAEINFSKKVKTNIALI